MVNHATRGDGWVSSTATADMANAYHTTPWQQGVACAGLALGDAVELTTGLTLLLTLCVVLGLGLLLAWSLGTLGNGLLLGVLLTLAVGLGLSLLLVPRCSVVTKPSNTWWGDISSIYVCLHFR